MDKVFTPLNETKTKRLRFDMKDVKILEGNLNRRVLGKKGVVAIEGKLYSVFGKACGIPNCTCDAYIKEIKEF